MAPSEDEPKAAETKVRVVPNFPSFKAPVKAVVKDTRTEEDELKGRERDRERDRDRRDSDKDRSRRHHRSRSPRKDSRHERHDRPSKSSHHHKSRHRSRSASPERKRRRRSHTPEPKRLPPPPSKPRPSELLPVREEDKKLFKIDLRGDKNNSLYQTAASKYAIPLYRREGFGCVMGVDKELRIDREKENEEKGIELVRGSGKKVRGQRRAALQGFAAVEGGRMLRIMNKEEVDSSTLDLGMAYVPVSKPREVEEEAAPEESGTFAFRQLKDVKKQPMEGELEEAEEDEYDEMEAYSSETVRKKTVELNRAVDNNPTDPETWLELVKHQDNIMHSTRTGKRITREERHSTREIKLDILQKALVKCPDSEDIIEAFMDVASEMWDSTHMQEEWDKVLRAHPSKLRLWIKYINFRQSDFSSFTFPETKKAYIQCLKVLRDAKWDAYQDRWATQRAEQIESVLVYLLLRGIKFMQEAGFIENAMAVLQSLVEVNFRRPAAVAVPTTQAAYDELISSYEEFWESEVPRAGEAGAKGWVKYHEEPEEHDAELQSPKSSDADFDICDPFGSWLELEEECCPLWRTPARTTDAVEDEDPYRVVLFDDVRDWIVVLDSTPAKLELVDTILVALGLPPCRAEPSIEKYRLDAFLVNDDTLATARHEDFWPKLAPSPKAIEWTISAPELTPPSDIPFGFILPNWPTYLETQLASHQAWFSDFTGLRGLQASELEFRSGLLRFLSETWDDEDFLTYFLAFQYRFLPKSVKKTARALLKMHKQSVRLWACYASIEAREGNAEQARTIFSTAIALANDLSKDGRNVFHTAPVWKARVSHELDLRNYGMVKSLICSIESGKYGGEADMATSTMLVRARRFLEDQEASAISLSEKAAACNINELRAILEYLSQDQDITPLVHVPDTLINELRARKTLDPLTHEQILIYKIKLLHHHISSVKLVPLKVFRTALEDAIKTYPTNTLFTSLYIQNESRSRIDNRVRDLFTFTILSPSHETVLGHLLAIWAELRLFSTTDTAPNFHTVRSLFENAVSCPRTRASVDLWKLYITFELQQRQPRRAKLAYFRAIRCCPWSKRLAMMAFRELRAALEEEDLRKVWKIVVVEKELRVHESREMEEWVERGERGEEGGRRGLGRHESDDERDVMLVDS